MDCNREGAGQPIRDEVQVLIVTPVERWLKLTAFICGLQRKNGPSEQRINVNIETLQQSKTFSAVCRLLLHSVDQLGRHKPKPCI